MSKRLNRKVRIADLEAERHRLIEEDREEELARSRIRHLVIGETLIARAKAGDAQSLWLCRDIAASVTRKAHKSAFEDWAELPNVAVVPAPTGAEDTPSTEPGAAANGGSAAASKPALGDTPGATGADHDGDGSGPECAREMRFGERI